MKKFYKVFLLLTAFIFLSTYSPNKFNLIAEKKNKFFAIKNIEVLNNSLLKKKELNEKLTSLYNKNIFLVKKQSIEDLLINVDFLKRIEFKKKYPDTLIIKVFETKPIAIFYKGKSKYLIDDISKLILFTDKMDYNKLPTVFGENAESNFIKFYSLLEKNNFPISKVKNFYYFQIGRWDLQFLNNKIIKFPYIDVKDAIKESIKLIDRIDFKNYKIIDLRVAGKIIVE